MQLIYISQPMKGRTDDDILEERTLILRKLQKKLNDDVSALDNMYESRLKINKHPLWFVGESLKKMAIADYVVFCDGWENERECWIEHVCAEKFRKSILEKI